MKIVTFHNKNKFYFFVLFYNILNILFCVPLQVPVAGPEAGLGAGPAAALQVSLHLLHEGGAVRALEDVLPPPAAGGQAALGPTAAAARHHGHLGGRGTGRVALLAADHLSDDLPQARVLCGGHSRVRSGRWQRAGRNQGPFPGSVRKLRGLDSFTHRPPTPISPSPPAAIAQVLATRHPYLPETALHLSIHPSASLPSRNVRPNFMCQTE